MEIVNLLESERSDLTKLRRLRSKFALDNEALTLLVELYDEKCERVISLTDLLHYRDRDEPASSASPVGSVAGHNGAEGGTG